MTFHAGIRPTTTGRGVAIRAMWSRIAANKFRVTDLWASLKVIDPFRYLPDVLRRPPTAAPYRLMELLVEVCFVAHPRATRKRVAKLDAAVPKVDNRIFRPEGYVELNHEA